MPTFNVTASRITLCQATIEAENKVNALIAADAGEGVAGPVLYTRKELTHVDGKRITKQDLGEI